MLICSTRGRWVNALWPCDTIWWNRWVNIGSGNGYMPWCHQAITWTNVDLYKILMRPSGINPRVMFSLIINIAIPKLCLKLIHLKSQPHLWDGPMSWISLASGTEYTNGLVQERRNSIANALELRLSCTSPWIYVNICSKSACKGLCLDLIVINNEDYIRILYYWSFVPGTTIDQWIPCAKCQ